VATSANRAGEAPAATAAVVRAAFGGGLDDVAEEDDGVQGRAPSTVVRLPAPLAGGSGATGWSCDILRAGGVAAEAVEAALRAAGR
jgi:tRNA A37 threonylcarbamoyladenosine synthetase subunit TsaC/SUA5/YrdC